MLELFVVYLVITGIGMLLALVFVGICLPDHDRDGAAVAALFFFGAPLWPIAAVAGIVWGALSMLHLAYHGIRILTTEEAE